MKSQLERFEAALKQRPYDLAFCRLVADLFMSAGLDESEARLGWTHVRGKRMPDSIPAE